MSSISDNEWKSWDSNKQEMTIWMIGLDVLKVIHHFEKDTLMQLGIQILK